MRLSPIGQASVAFTLIERKIRVDFIEARCGALNFLNYRKWFSCAVQHHHLFADFDSFTGEPDKIGIGNGSAFRRQLAERLIAVGVPIVAVEPDAKNVGPRRDYAKAGFRLTGIVEISEGLVALMIFDQVPPTSKSSPCFGAQ